MNEWGRKRVVMHRYDLTADMYDTRYAEEQKAKIEVALENLAIEKPALILDVGCGTGILFGYIVEKADAIVGLDISRKNLFKAKKRAKNFGNAHLVLADADNMPFKGNVFTHVFGVTLLQNMPNPIKTLREIRRVARKDAVVVATGLKKTFALDEFQELMADAGFVIVDLKGEGLKCYVAVCRISP
ncbi:MAG: methyltransferase domain-containing protein [Candidatus Bathyarchaeia archaeon]